MAPRTVLVTGANRGIGFCILQALITATPTDRYILAARSQKSIDDAIASLCETPEIKAATGKIVIEGVVLDVTDDVSIISAVETVKVRFGSLDVLVNNAGIAHIPSDSLSDNRAAFSAVLDANVTSVANVTQAFIPLLRSSTSTSTASESKEGTRLQNKPLVINISSGRASLTRSTTGGLPPTASVPYSVSKVALNALTIEMAKSHPEVSFQCANPGHCKTSLNGYRGARDPLEGAGVVVEIVKRAFSGDGEDLGTGFWETVGDAKALERVPW